MTENRESASRLATELLAGGEVGEALRLAESIALDFQKEPQASSQLLEVRLRALHGLGRWTDIVEFGTPTLASLTKAGAVDLCSTIHGHLGTAFARLGQLRLAEDHIRAAIHIATWVLEKHAEALRHRRRLVVLFKNFGLWQISRFEAERAIEESDQRGFTAESAALRINLAVVLLKSGCFVKVPKLLDDADRLSTESGRTFSANLARLLRARFLILNQHPAQALDLLTSTLATTREQHYSREEAICLEYMGDCYLAQKEFKKALEHYQAAQKIAEETAPKGDLIPELGHRIGEALVNLGDPNGAILSCERGLRVARDTGDRYEECATQRVLAMANWASGNPRKALRIIAEGVELGRSYEIPFELARALQWGGEVRLQDSSPDEQTLGRRHLWEARAIFERLGLTHQTRQIERLLGLESQPEPEADEPGIAVLQGLEGLDRGALRFGIITCNPAVSEAVAIVQSVAQSPIPVLIQGQSGVGKELLAKALHLMSARRKGPFVPVNCGAVSPGLIESEFFGHERGAFTGAVATREGLIAAAHQGTFFLDEIGELSPAAQATLLRVLETGELRPVGRDDVRTINVRIVAATNANLYELVERGAFRHDLFYRLNGVVVTLPPLQEREEDIRALFRYFWAQAVVASKKGLTLADDVEAMLSAYAWPGNVRELKNEITRAVAIAPASSIVTRDSFLPQQRARTADALRRSREQLAETSAEREEILRALRAHRGNKADAARSLGGMKRTTLLYKMERLGIRPEEYQVNE